MGYYTNYDFSENSSEVIAAIEKVSGYGESSGGFYYGVKWYNALRDVESVSKQFPEELIKLYGKGEEWDDIWRAYFKNGKGFYTRAKMVFEEFSEDKLK